MRFARRNPLGLPLDRAALLREGSGIVRVGSGEHTHLLHPSGVQLCRMGKRPGRQGPSTQPSRIEQTDARFVTCYRCQKLATVNLTQGRKAWEPPLDGLKSYRRGLMARKNPDKTVHFFTPSYPASSKEEYREEVEKGPKPFPPREEDERDLHIMIRGGRSAARYANVAESIGALEDEASLARRATRWEDQLRPWDARTQSPTIRERMQPVSVEEIRDYILMSLGPGASQEEIAAAMEEAIRDVRFIGDRAPIAKDEKVLRVRDAIARYMQQQNQTLGFSVPDTVDPLIAAGMPQDIAEILVRRAARRLFPTEDLVFVPEPPSVRAIIQRRFADLGRFRVTGTAIDPTFAFARGAQTTADIERIFVQDLRTRRSLGSVSEKQLSDLLGGRGKPFESILSGFYALVERMFEFAARQADPTALVFILRSRETGQQVVRSLSAREHSKFLQGQQTARRMDYRTLQNIPLSDLPRILVGISRKGRRRARSNPMPEERADAAILDTVVAAYNQNQLVDVPGQPGMVYWPISKGRGKRHRFVGIKTTTRERAQSWIDLAVLRRQQAGDGVFPVTASQPLPAPAPVPVPEVAMRNSDEDYWFHQYGRAPFGAGRNIPTARRNPMKKNPSEDQIGEAFDAGFTFPGGDENYEIALSEGGSVAYMVVGRVERDDDSRKMRPIWDAGRGLPERQRRAAQQKAIDEAYSLPEDFFPTDTLVIVSLEPEHGGKPSGYYVYFASEEDIALRSPIDRPFSLEDAMYLAQYYLEDASKPKYAGKIYPPRYMELLRKAYGERVPGGRTSKKKRTPRPDAARSTARTSNKKSWAMKKNPWYESLYLPDTTEVRSALVPAPRGWHDDTEVRSALVPGPYGKKNPRHKMGIRRLDGARAPRPSESQKYVVVFIHPEYSVNMHLEFIGPADGTDEDLMAIAASNILAETDAYRKFSDAYESIKSITPDKPKSRRRKKKARRNSSAAREAMRLHHEDGMSLKDAWKHVKRNPGVFGTSSLDVAKPGRIKFNPGSRHNGAASEAMRLHHETGMSLKDAWAQVKRNPSHRPYSKFSARGLPQYEQIMGQFSTTQRATHGIQPSNRRNPGRRSALMNPLTNTFNPNLHCCVTGQHIPIGAPMVVHPTMKGPRGGKRYCIPGAI